MQVFLLSVVNEQCYPDFEALIQCYKGDTQRVARQLVGMIDNLVELLKCRSKQKKDFGIRRAAAQKLRKELERYDEGTTIATIPPEWEQDLDTTLEQ